MIDFTQYQSKTTTHLDYLETPSRLTQIIESEEVTELLKTINKENGDAA